jgi:hypothetical protein
VHAEKKFPVGADWLRNNEMQGQLTCINILMAQQPSELSSMFITELS